MYTISKNPDGGYSITSDGGLKDAVKKFIITFEVLTMLKFLPEEFYSMFVKAFLEYAEFGTVELPSQAAQCIYVFRELLKASEAENKRAIAMTNAGQKAASARWGNRSDAELERIEIPPISIPPGLGLVPIQRGGVTIEPEEYVSVASLFFLRSFKDGEVARFYHYWAGKAWNDNAITDKDGRMNRAQRWNQLDGSHRFADDQAAGEFLKYLFLALPEDKRIYMLSSGVSMSVTTENKIIITADQSLLEFIETSDAVKAKLTEYRLRHNLPDGTEWGMNHVDFQMNI